MKNLKMYAVPVMIAAAVIAVLTFSVTSVFAHREAEHPAFMMEVTSSPNEVEIKGIVESITGEQWVIGGMTFKVDKLTFLAGQPVTGSFVEVKGFVQSDGTTLAVSIKLEDDMNSSSAEIRHDGSDDGLNHDLNDDGTDHQRGRKDSGSDDSGGNSGKGK
jgi:methionine-rich copper-binding protein CopC